MLSDPRSLRKLRIIDHQIDTDFEAEKWSKSVIKQVREASKSEGKKAVLKNNNTSVEIEMERKRKKKLSTPLSVTASADMDSRASTLLRLLNLNKNSNAHIENEEHLLDCKFRQKKTVKTTRKKKKCSPKPSLEVSSTSRTADKVKMKSKSEGREKSTKTSESKRCGVEASPILTSSRSSDRGSVKGSVRGSDKGTPSTASTVKSRGSKTSDSKILRKKISSKGEDRALDSVDEGFRNFHYSVNLLRDSILQGTVAARCDTSSRTAGEEDEDDDEEEEDGEEEEEDEVSDSAGSDRNQNLNSRDTRDLSSRSSASQAMRDASVASYSLSLRDSMVDNYEDFALRRNARPRPSGVGVGVLIGPRSAPSQPERTEQDWVNWAKMGARAPLEDRDFEGFFPPKDNEEEEEEEEGMEYGTDGPRSDTPPESSSTHEYENQNQNQHSYADDMNDSDSESESDSDDGLISYDLPDEGSPGRGAERAFEGNMIGSRMSPSAANRGRESDREGGRERDGGDDGDGEGMFGDDSAAVMIGDRGPWGGYYSSSGESYESESSEDDEEEEEEEEEEQQRNRYRTIPAGYSDSVPAVSDYRGPTSDILNSYMNEIYST